MAQNSSDDQSNVNSKVIHFLFFIYVTICHFFETRMKPFPCHHWTVYITNAFLNLLDDCENVCCSAGQWKRLKVCEASSNTPPSTIQSCQGKLLLGSSSEMSGVKERR